MACYNLKILQQMLQESQVCLTVWDIIYSIVKLSHKFKWKQRNERQYGILFFQMQNDCLSFFTERSISLRVESVTNFQYGMFP